MIVGQRKIKCLPSIHSYKQATENRAKFITACKTNDACQNFLDLLALWTWRDHYYLTICDSLANDSSLMNNFFLPTSKQLLPTFQTFCPVGVHFAQTVVCFAHFQVQDRKGGVFEWGWGCFKYLHIPKKAWVKNRGSILGKMRPQPGKMRSIWAICTKGASGQKRCRIGKKKFNHSNLVMPLPQPWREARDGRRLCRFKGVIAG